MNQLPVAASMLLLTLTGASEPIKPGRWQVLSTPTNIEMPNSPGAGLLKHIIGRASSNTLCLTSDQARHGISSILDIAKSKCEYTALSITGDKFNATVACRMQQGRSNVTISGIYTAFSADMTIKAATGKPVPVTITSHVVYH